MAANQTLYKNAGFSRLQKLVLLAGSAFRILLSWWIGNYFNSANYFDDYLMVQYADLQAHFTRETAWAMVKDMSYPLFLNIPSMTGLTYNVLLSLVWIWAAWMIMKVIQNFTWHKYIWIAGYFYILFSPCAFDVWTGIRMYRNAIIAPFLYLVFAYMILILIQCWKREELNLFSFCWDSVVLSILFVFTYYIKEDGFWMILVLLVVSSGCMAGLFFMHRRLFRRLNKKLAGIFLCLLLPYAAFFSATEAYKQINAHYFKVAEINTRTGGAMGQFVQRVYQIESQQRTANIWAPDDAIEKAFAASPTLSQHPEFLDYILNNSFYQDEMIQGDFLGWVLREALVYSNLWQSEEAAQAFFSQVNEELDEAFANGTLQKSSRIQLVKSASGRTLSEIAGLSDDMAQMFKSIIFLNGYASEVKEDIDKKPEMHASMSYLSNTYVYPLEKDTLINRDTFMKKAGCKIAGGIFWIYRILNPCLLICGIFEWFRLLWTGIQNKNKDCRFSALTWLGLVSVFVLIGMSLAYSFGICWFSEFIYRNDFSYSATILKFYGVGAVPMVYTAFAIITALSASHPVFKKSCHLLKQNG